MSKQALLFCPACGKDNFVFDGYKKYHCRCCQFVFFFNAAAAVGAVIIHRDHLLVAVRGREPGLGQFDFPGGFVDPGESASQALLRELQEELTAEPETVEYFCSASNIYPYESVEYSICDIFYRCTFSDYDQLQANDDVAELHWIRLNELDADNFAFVSAPVIIEKILADRNPGH